MATSFEDVLAELPAERRERILKRAEALSDDPSELQAALDAEETAERRLFSSPLSFEIFRDAGGGYRFRLSTSSGADLIESPAFGDKVAAEKALNTFRRHLDDAEIAKVS